MSRRRVWGTALAVGLLAACTTSPGQRPGDEPPARSAPPGPAPSAPPPEVVSGDGGVPDAPPIEPPPAVAAERALTVVFGEDGVDAAARECLAAAADPARIECMIERRFAVDDKAKESALDLFRQGGIVTGVNPAMDMDGGWRGKLRLVPELPVGPHRRHVAWVATAHRDLDAFFATLAEHAKRPIPYRWRALELRFFRSVGRTTPSAYAEDWAIAYNVSGSLHSDADAVRETWFHEIFHLNDQHHQDWSVTHLTPLYDAIVTRCSSGGRLSTPCLTPYAPNHTMVRGGTFYAFQPGNGVGEYAAELALRFYREHRDHAAGRAPVKPPFKCGPDPSREAWRLMSEEFFAGVDLIPDC